MTYRPIDLPGIFYMKLNQHLQVGEYRRLCRELRKSKYSVVRASEALRLFDQKRLMIKDRVRVIWIHDVESPSDNWLAEEMAEVEAAHGFASTYNIRTFCAMDNELRKTLRRVVKWGGEIQYQYEDLVTAHGDVRLARRMFGENLKWLRRHFPRINVAFSHGVWLSGLDSADQFKVGGRWRPALWTRYGIHPDGELSYFMDILRETYGARFHFFAEPRYLGADEFLTALDETVPGDIVMFLQHPGWWSTIIDIGQMKTCLRESVFFKK